MCLFFIDVHYQFRYPEVKMKLLSRVQLFATLWTVTYQAPLSMGFSRQEYWSVLSFPSPGDLPNPGIEPSLPHCRHTLYHLSHQGSLRYLSLQKNFYHWWVLDFLKCSFCVYWDDQMVIYLFFTLVMWWIILNFGCWVDLAFLG